MFWFSLSTTMYIFAVVSQDRNEIKVSEGKAMSISNEEYGKMTKRASPNSPVIMDCLKAFLFGGAICAFAQGLNIAFGYTDMTQEESKALTMTILIAITAILTAVGVFDKIAKHAGAGTAVPITGFANSMSSSALESKSEGLLLGIVTNTFKLAGSVIVVGALSGIIVSYVIFLLGV